MITQLVHISDLHIGEDADLNDYTTIPKMKLWDHLLKSQRRKIDHPGTRYASRSTCSHRGEVIPHLERFIAQAAKSSEAIVVTGDLARTGLQSDLEAALEVMRGVSRAAVGSESHCLPTFLVPGNHDRWNDESGSAGGTNFDSVFHSFWSAGRGGVQSHTVASRTSAAPEIRLVSADLCLLRSTDGGRPTMIARRGRGRAYRRTIRRLIVETRRLRQTAPSALIIWMVHFPPIEKGEKYYRRLRLVNHGLLTRAANRLKIRAILAGHTHQFGTRTYGDIQVITAGSASCVSRNSANSVHLLRVDASSSPPTILRANYLYNNDFGGFELYTANGSPEIIELATMQ